jgi:hypothetical protein
LENLESSQQKLGKATLPEHHSFYSYARERATNSTDLSSSNQPNKHPSSSNLTDKSSLLLSKQCRNSEKLPEKAKIETALKKLQENLRD